MLAGRLATGLPKLRPGMDVDEYRETAREKCREIFTKLIGKIEREDGE